MSKGLINKSMNINEIIIRFPETVDVFMDYGLHCFGCALASGENLEQGAKTHGMSETEINKMVEDANKIALKYYPNDEDKNEIMHITSRAAEQVKKMIESYKGTKYLRIGIIDFEFGQRYSFKAEKVKKKGDVNIKVGKVSFILDKKNALVLKGSTLDYLDFMPGNGFKIYTPNKI